MDYHSSRRTDIDGIDAKDTKDPSDANHDHANLAQSITIMGDSRVTYAALKQIMQACASTGYTNLALAVENKTDTGSALSSGGIQ